MKTKSKSKRAKRDTRIKEAAPRGVRAAAPVKPASKPLSPVAAMRAVLAKDPSASVEQIEAALAKQGMSKSRVTIATKRQRQRANLPVLRPAVD